MALLLQDYQVLQRDADGVARVLLADGTTRILPVGGPYSVAGAQDVLVGDLWLLAGQSNMEGNGDLIDVETPSPLVHSYQSREVWAVAEEPLVWHDESPRAIHHRLLGRDGVPARPPARDPHRAKGAGPGLTFARERVARTGLPIGLIPCAHNATSLSEWDPALKERGGDSLYGALLARVAAVGGTVAGVLWYQGESDANPVDLPHYAERTRAFVQALRADLDQPNLPFYYVQLSRYVIEVTPERLAGWNGVREAQRRLQPTIPNAAMVAAIDLEIDDHGHIGAGSVQRLGRRLAAVAAGRRSPDVAAITVEEGGRYLRVRFDHVEGALRAAGRPAGFSLRDAAEREIPCIYRIRLQGDAALLYLDPEGVPPSAALWYGWGLDPYCNITDSGDLAIPAFGPLPIG
jgi:sialate O-acetylesterase